MSNKIIDFLKDHIIVILVLFIIIIAAALTITYNIIRKDYYKLKNECSYYKLINQRSKNGPHDKSKNVLDSDSTPSDPNSNPPSDNSTSNPSTIDKTTTDDT